MAPFCAMATDADTFKCPDTKEAACTAFKAKAEDIVKKANALSDDEKEKLNNLIADALKKHCTGTAAATDVEGNGDNDDNDEYDTEEVKDGVTDTETDEAQKKAEQEQKLTELRENAQAMKDKEQSTENKLLGAAGIGATGMGAMEMASAMAEQQADQDAEAAMRAYLATFSCKYGNTTVTGGTQNAEIPGGNELINLYSEYVNLANDLKVRKNALGLKPGIESESILDSATAGLYDDVSVGKTSGAYTSLARALADPTGEDAQKWKAQQEQTAEKLKKGAITAGIGAAGSLVANLAINANSAKEKSDEIKRKYADIVPELKKIQKTIDAKTIDCAKIKDAKQSGKTCTCTKSNQYFSDGECKLCENGKKLVDGICKKECELKGRVKSDSCKCADNATEKDGECTCNNGYDPSGDNACVLKSTTPETPSAEQTIHKLSLPTDGQFDSDKSTLKSEDLIDKIAAGIQTAINSASDSTTLPNDICIVVVGHADYTGDNNVNNRVSTARAKTVAEKIQAKYATDENITQKIKHVGMGETECVYNKNGKYNNNDRHKCRRVDIIIAAGSCDKTDVSTQEKAQSFLEGVANSITTGTINP